MIEFTKELNKLLEKYPDLGAFTINVQPRLIIMPSVQEQKYVDAAKTTTTIATSSDKPIILQMEGKINKAKLAELARSTQIE